MSGPPLTGSKAVYVGLAKIGVVLRNEPGRTIWRAMLRNDADSFRIRSLSDYSCRTGKKIKFDCLNPEKGLRLKIRSLPSPVDVPTHETSKSSFLFVHFSKNSRKLLPQQPELPAPISKIPVILRDFSPKAGDKMISHLHRTHGVRHFVPRQC